MPPEYYSKNFIKKLFTKAVTGAPIFSSEIKPGADKGDYTTEAAKQWLEELRKESNQEFHKALFQTQVTTQGPVALNNTMKLEFPILTSIVARLNKETSIRRYGKTNLNLTPALIASLCIIPGDRVDFTLAMSESVVYTMSRNISMGTIVQDRDMYYSNIEKEMVAELIINLAAHCNILDNAFDLDDVKFSSGADGVFNYEDTTFDRGIDFDKINIVEDINE